MNFTGEAINLRLRTVRRFANSHRLESYLPQVDGLQFFLGSEELSEAFAMKLYPQVIHHMIELQEYRPKAMTITDYIRDEPYFIEAKWVNEIRFSEAVKTIEIESITFMI